MEANGLKKWSFLPNHSLLGEASLSIRAVLEELIDNTNPDDDKTLISLGNGDPSLFPLFRTSMAAQEAVIDAIRSAKYNCYSPTVGLIQSRDAVADYLSRDLPYQLSGDDIFLTVGCTQAIEIVITVLASPGSNILLPRPGYPHYSSRAAFSNLQARYYNLLPDKGWEVDLHALETLADDNTVAMVITNPGNPCGNVYSYQHLQQIAETAKHLGILVISDEVYAHVTFGNKFVSMGVFGPISPVLIVGSLSKRWVLPGWRLGWLASADPNGILKKSGIVKCIKDYVNISVDPVTFIQAAVPRILKEVDDGFFSRVIDILRKDVSICCEIIEGTPCITCPYRPEGSMFVMVKLEIAQLKDIGDDMEFCLKLAKEESVIVLPAYTLGMKNWVRLSFAIDPSILEDALGRIKAFCMRHAKCCNGMYVQSHD